MSRQKIRYLVEKPGPLFYWQPAASLRRQGWRTERLAPGGDRVQAIAEAEAINKQLDDWRAGGDPAAAAIASRRPARIKAADTVAALIAAYKASPKYRRLSEKSKRGYKYNIQRIEDWAGDVAVRAITPKACKDFHRSMAATPSTAKAVIAMLRALYKWAVSEDLAGINPAALIEVAGTPPRQVFWPDAAIDHFIAVADTTPMKDGRVHRSVATAVAIAAFVGQREGDVLALRWNAYRDGCFRFRQSKRGRLVEVPALPELRRRLDGLRAEQAAAGVLATHIVVSETTGRPYNIVTFQQLFARIRAAAAATMPIVEYQRHDSDPRPFGDLWFADLRRSAVVMMAEEGTEIQQIAAVTGHSIERAKQILEVYLPRTGKMAAAAIENLAARRARGRKTEQD